jgi:hypothetical protein
MKKDSKSKDITRKKASRLATLLAGMVGLAGCGDGGPEYGDLFSIQGKVLEIEGEFAVDGRYHAGRDLLIESGGQLYHVGTNRESRWDDIGVGDRVTISGQHGGPCEEDFMFEAFEDEKGYYTGSIRPEREVGNIVFLGNPNSKDVIDMIHVDVERTYSVKEASKENIHNENRTDFGDFEYNPQAATALRGWGAEIPEDVGGWAYEVQRGDNPTEISRLFNEQDRTEGNLRLDVEPYNVFRVEDERLVTPKDRSLQVGETLYIVR